MTTTKQRLEKAIKKCTESAHSSGFISDDYEAGANLLAPLLLEMVEAIQRRMKSDEACGHHFDENLGDALNEMEKFLK
jgi:uncharacterized membrane-anchored protein YjiN (DUF445 family)